jgi:hypothetical protein
VGVKLPMNVRRSAIVFLTLFVSMTALAFRIPGAEQTSREDPEQLIGKVPQLRVRPATLADNIDFFAGREVAIFDARVVGVFEPHAFLIESATRHPESIGQRDRVLVLIDDGVLCVPAELAVASTVKVAGIARTLLGMKVSAEVQWPTRLDRKLVDRLEIRGSVLATSVQTPEGIELTDRSDGAPSPCGRSR